MLRRKSGLIKQGELVIFSPRGMRNVVISRYRGYDVLDTTFACPEYAFQLYQNMIVEDAWKPIRL